MMLEKYKLPDTTGLLELLNRWVGPEIPKELQVFVLKIFTNPIVNCIKIFGQ
jgi:hypothetical protein